MKKTNNEIEETKEILPVDLQEQIEKWKKEYSRVYKTTVADEKIIWRPLKRSEYSAIMVKEYNENEELAYYEKQEFIAETVILYPLKKEEFIEDFAGIADIIATECMVQSGFGKSNTETL